jgi:hypothetical protein
MSLPISGQELAPSRWGNNSTAKSVTPSVLESNPVRILAWQRLVIALGINNAGMQLVDAQMVEE